MTRIAVYPGSFDPMTRGHLDIVERARRLFERVIVTVSCNSAKKHTFGVSERLRLIRACVGERPGVRVESFSGLLVDYLREKKARVLIRGLRAVSDMEYEFQIASMNRRLHPDIETVFLMPDERYTHLSSSIVKEVARLGARVDDFVTEPVARALRAKFPVR